MAEFDIVEKMGQSLIHHGKQSNRIYLMKFCQSDMPGLLLQLRDLAESCGYSKVICKIPADHFSAFAAEGYIEEAEIPGYFSGNGKCLFVSRFVNKEREEQTDKDLINGVFAAAKRRNSELKAPGGIAEGLSCDIMREGDAVEMATVYRTVFDTYPFPIHDPEYIVRTMRENVVYFGVRKDRRLIALSSIEADMENRNAEMTDFATLPEYRGGGLAKYLLQKMEKEFLRMGLITAYTIARAVSFGMNLTFSGRGYTYGGTLINNTQISGALESMNIWYKPIQ